MTNRQRTVTCARQLDFLVDNLCDHLFKKHTDVFDQHYLRQFEDVAQDNKQYQTLCDDYAKEDFRKILD